MNISFFQKKKLDMEEEQKRILDLKEKWIHRLLLSEHDPKGLLEINGLSTCISLN